MHTKSISVHAVEFNVNSCKFLSIHIQTIQRQSGKYYCTYSQMNEN